MPDTLAKQNIKDLFEMGDATAFAQLLLSCERESESEPEPEPESEPEFEPECEYENDAVMLLQGTSPQISEHLSFVTDLGIELANKEFSAFESFTIKKNEIKAAILEGRIPGIFALNDEAAESIANDMAYHTSAEGFALKAVYSLKQRLYSPIKNSRHWKAYLSEHNELVSYFFFADVAEVLLNAG